MRICFLADGRFINAHRWLHYFSERGVEMHLVSFVPVELRHIVAVTDPVQLFRVAHLGRHRLRHLVASA